MQLLYAILCSLNLVIATYITNSTITTDYTFSVADSPYYIETNVTFTKNVLIENGAEIIFLTTSQIMFYANVTAGCDDIDTTSNNDRGLMNSSIFTYIHRDDTLTSPTGFITLNTQHPANAILEFCNVKFHGMQLAIQISTPIVFANILLLIDNCEFHNNNYATSFSNDATRSTFIHMSDSIISNTIHVNNYGRAVYDNCDINNYETFCNYRCLQIAMRNSKLSRNTADTASDTHCIAFGANAYWGTGDEKAAFYNNVISDCGIGISYVASKWIINNTFSNIHGQVIQVPFATRKYELFVINNTFINNDLHSVFYLKMTNITIKGNRFINNIASDNSLIYVDGYLHSYPNYLSFQDNTFTSNQAANRLITVNLAIIDFINNIFIDNIAAVSSVSTVNDIIADNAAIYFGFDFLYNLIFRSNTFQGNTWNAYFIYANCMYPINTIIIQYNLFNDTHIGPTAKLLSICRSAYTGLGVLIQENTFIAPPISGPGGSISAIIDKISMSIGNRRIQYNNFHNANASTFFIETSGYRHIKSATQINHNYFDGLMDVNDILNKIDPYFIGLQCQVIQPFYKDPIDMNDMLHLPTECVLASAYSSSCSYNGNIIGCITQSPTTTPTSATVMPSESPSHHPSQTPTTDPTVDPTSHPFISPTYHPTMQPTKLPTSYPSNNPSSAPSNEPSSDPSMQPTHETTVTPTMMHMLTTKMPSRRYMTTDDTEITNTNGKTMKKYLMAVLIVLLSINI